MSTKTDGERVVDAEQAEPKAQASQSQTDSSTSAGISDGENPWDELAGQFDERFTKLSEQLAEAKEEAKRGNQRVKDKRLAALENEIGKLKAGFVSLADQRAGSSTQASRLGTQESETASTVVQEAFVLAGIAEDVNAVENSPEYLKFFAQNKGRVDTNKAVQYLRELKQGQQAVNVSAGAIAQPPGGSAQQSSDEQNQNEYVKEMNANRGNVTAIRDVQAKFRKLGVPIEQIGFN